MLRRFRSLKLLCISVSFYFSLRERRRNANQGENPKSRGRENVSEICEAQGKDRRR